MSETPHHGGHEHTGQRVGYASPAEAMQAPREAFVYVACLYEGTGINEPDFLAVVDVHPDSDTYQQIVHRVAMRNVGDELHHYGWQVCSSACHSNLQRANLVVPGLASSRVHIVNVAIPQILAQRQATLRSVGVVEGSDPASV